MTTPAASRWFGRVAVTHAVEQDGSGARLVCRLAVARQGRLQRVRSRLLAWGGLMMMRRQLLTLKALAERDARRP